MPLAPAYPEQVAFVRSLEAALGPEIIQNAYMDDAGMEPIIEALAARWKTKADDFRSRFIKYSEKRFIPDEREPAEDSIRTLLKNEHKWLGVSKDQMWDHILA